MELKKKKKRLNNIPIHQLLAIVYKFKRRIYVFYIVLVII